MQAIRPAPAGHEAASELIDDEDFAVVDHVLDVELVERVRLQGLVDGVQRVHVRRVVELDPAEEFLGVQDALLGEHGRVLLLVDLVVLLDDELGNDPVDRVELVDRLFRRPADDERRPGLVDEDGVDLVDDGEDVVALDHGLEIELHVVAQIVEAELVVRPVSDVTPVGILALAVAVLVLDHADGESKEAVDASHPLGVAAGQVVVDGDEVDAAAGQGVEINGERGNEGLAFTRLHLGDLAAMQHDATHELDVEVPHVEHALAGRRASSASWRSCLATLSAA